MTNFSDRVQVRTKKGSSDVRLDDSLMPFNEAIAKLVIDYGLREDAARTIIKRAAVIHGLPFTVHIKRAQPQGDPYLTLGGPTAPADPGPAVYAAGNNPFGANAQTMLMSEYELPVYNSQPNNRSMYDVRPEEANYDLDVIQRAMATGQKEVFDTAMIGSMLKTVRDDMMIERYLPDLVKAMDRLGRLIFMFYWHGDVFVERFGSQDMPELEDGLRNTFEFLGDIVLFLKQKTIEPYPEEDAVDLNVDRAAAV